MAIPGIKIRKAWWRRDSAVKTAFCVSALSPTPMGLKCIPISSCITSSGVRRTHRRQTISSRNFAMSAFRARTAEAGQRITGIFIVRLEEQGCGNAEAEGLGGLQGDDEIERDFMKRTRRGAGFTAAGAVAFYGWLEERGSPAFLRRSTYPRAKPMANSTMPAMRPHTSSVIFFLQTWAVA
jgi:hypothetical protein